MPSPSAPSTQATALGQIAPHRVVLRRASSAPTIQMPRSFSSRSVRARLVTMMYGHAVGRAAGHLDHRGAHARRTVLGRDHRVHAGGIGHAQAGAEIVRVGDAVEHQQQRRLGEPCRAGRRGSSPAHRSAPRATTPWWLPAGHAVQAPPHRPASRARSALSASFTRSRMRASRARAVDSRVPAPSSGCAAQPRDDGVKAVDEARGATQLGEARLRQPNRSCSSRSTRTSFTRMRSAEADSASPVRSPSSWWRAASKWK